MKEPTQCPDGFWMCDAFAGRCYARYEQPVEFAQAGAETGGSRHGGDEASPGTPIAAMAAPTRKDREEALG